MRASNAAKLAVCVFTVSMIPAASVRTQAPETAGNGAARAERAGELMKQARAAAGGDEALARVAGLSATVELRRHVEYTAVSPSSIQERATVLKGKIRIELLKPGRFRKQVSTATLSGFKASYVEVVNGSKAWRDPPPTAVSSSRQRHVIDVSDFERSLNYQAQGARQQFTLYALALLIWRPPEESLTLSSAGWMERDNSRCDVISIYGPGEFYAGLLLDQKTHLPVALIQDIVAARPAPVIVEGIVWNRRGWEELVQRARRARVVRMRPPRRMRVEYFFSDRRTVDGISLPHRITTKVDGELIEELRITGIKINPRLNPNDFEPKAQKPSYSR